MGACKKRAYPMAGARTILDHELWGASLRMLEDLETGIDRLLGDTAIAPRPKKRRYQRVG